MKKFLMSVVGSFTLFGGLFILTSVSAHSDCKEVEFDNNVTACVSIGDAGSDDRELSASVDNGTTAHLRCDIMTPDSSLQNVPNCDGEFSYDDGDTGRIKLWIRYDEEAPEDREDKPGSSSTWTYPQWIFNFDDEEWEDGNYYTNNDSNGDLDGFDISLSDTTPAEDDEVTLTLEALDDSDDTLDTYDGSDATISIEYRTTSNGTWHDATTTQVLVDDKTPAFDNGEAETHITFKYSYEYKITVTDDDEDVTDYKSFEVGDFDGGGSNNGDLDGFDISLSDTTPAEDDEVTLTLEALDDNDDTLDTYDGSDATISIKYRTTSNGTWYTATTTQVLIDDSTPDFDNGEAETDITFKYSYEYKITVTDDDEDVTDYESFEVGDFDGGGSNNNGDLDGFDISLSDTTPAEDDEVTLTLEALDDSDDTLDTYDGSDATISIKYRTTSNGTWYTATTTQVLIDDSTPAFDNGEAETDITFKYSYEYKITVTDDDEDVTDYKSFEVGDFDGGGSNNDGEIDNFYVTADNNSPDRNEYVDITIEARDGNYDTIENYTNKAKFSVKKKSGSSRGIASSSYYTLARTYYTFTSSDDGEKTLTNLIKFKQDGEYKLIVYDEDEITADGERIFDVNNGGSSSDIDGFTSAEINTVQSIYNARPGTIDNLKDQYSKLRNSTTWNTRSDTFYDDTKDILDDVSNKKYDDFDTWYTALISRWRYTISIR